MTQVNKFGIDVETASQSTLMRRLKALRSSVTVTDGGHYMMCPGYSQVIVETTKTETELDDWLYKTKGIEYIGIFVVAS
jgi:hypothetical protein